MVNFHGPFSFFATFFLGNGMVSFKAFKWSYLLYNLEKFMLCCNMAAIF
jgi:hypothetical protein